jgi:F-type H+-transporting ATPase subunit O
LPQFTAAAKTAALDPTARALDSLGKVLKRDAKLPRILSAPSLTADDKKAIVAELQKHATSGGDVIKNFLNTLAENNRLGALEGVCDKFAELMSAHRGEVELVITSAAVCARGELPGPN